MTMMTIAKFTMERSIRATIALAGMEFASLNSMRIFLPILPIAHRTARNVVMAYVTLHLAKIRKPVRLIVIAMMMTYAISMSGERISGTARATAIGVEMEDVKKVKIIQLARATAQSAEMVSANLNSAKVRVPVYQIVL